MSFLTSIRKARFWPSSQAETPSAQECRVVIDRKRRVAIAGLSFLAVFSSTLLVFESTVDQDIERGLLLLAVIPFAIAASFVISGWLTNRRCSDSAGE